MAESADVLTGDHQRVILPDLNAGCSMADMADLDQVEEAWDAIAGVTDIDRVVPITYMNSSAALKAFVGRARRRGVHVVERPGRPRVGARPRATRSCSSPTSTSAATPASTMGYGEADMRVWNPRRELGGLEERDVKDATFLLWKGHCSVHQRFRPEHVDARSAPSTRAARSSCTPSARTTSSSSPTRSAPPSASSSGSSGAAPGTAIGDRHRDPHGAAPGRASTPTRRSCRSTR